MSDTIKPANLLALLLELDHDPEVRSNLENGLSDFCHHARNRLNSLKLSIYLAKRQVLGRSNSLWTDVEYDYKKIEAQFEQIHSIYQPAVLSRVSIPLTLLLEDRRAAWTKSMAYQGCVLHFEPPIGQPVARFDPILLGRGLDLLVAWRANLATASGPVVIRWGVSDGEAFVRWDETLDHPIHLIAEDALDASNWNLTFLRRLIAAHGGIVKLTTREGWSLEMTWPA